MVILKNRNRNSKELSHKMMSIPLQYMKVESLFCFQYMNDIIFLFFSFAKQYNIIVTTQL